MAEKEQDSAESDDGMVQCSLGGDTSVDPHVAVLKVGTYSLKLNADQADEMSADLRRIAIELRSGGRLS